MGVTSVKDLKKSVLKEILRPAKAGLKNDLMIFEEFRIAKEINKILCRISADRPMYDICFFTKITDKKEGLSCMDSPK